MKFINKSKIISFISIGSLLCTMPFTAYTDQQTITIEKIFDTTIENDTGTDFFDAIYEQNGLQYELTNVETEILSSRNIDGDTYIYKTDGAGSEESLNKPEESVEHNGTIYKLEDYVLKTEEVQNRTEYVEETIQYEGIDVDSELPGLAEITETDFLGNEVTEWLPLINYTIDNKYWDSTFEFPIKITNYDADTFLLNGVEIGRDEDLINYASEFLEYLNLSKDYYRISSIDWTGEEYTENGVVYRNATAKGDKMVMDVAALYGGEMTFGAGTMYYYECTYINPEKPDSIIYTVKATGTYVLKTITEDSQKQGLFRQLIDWVINNPIIALGIGTVAIIGIIIIILFILSRRKKDIDNKPKYDIINIEQNDKE